MIRFARTAFAALLLGGALALPLTHGLAPQAALAAGGPTSYEAGLVGYWHNADRNTRDITLLHVYYSTQYHADRVDVWGKCFPRDCYWGTQTVRFEAPPIGIAQYYLASHVIHMVRAGAHLDVYDFFIPFPWDSRPGYTVHGTFVPGT